eukprot:376375-Prorocentrum_minimum.AAC.1
MHRYRALQGVTGCYRVLQASGAGSLPSSHGSLGCLAHTSLFFLMSMRRGGCAAYTALKAASKSPLVRRSGNGPPEGSRTTTSLAPAASASAS